MGCCSLHSIRTRCNGLARVEVREEWNRRVFVIPAGIWKFRGKWHCHCEKLPLGSPLIYQRILMVNGAGSREWNEEEMLFNDWSGIGRVLATGGLSFLALVLLLRLSGKRTLSKMNAFDLVVTIAIGSTLSTMLVTEQAVWAEGVTAFFVLVGLQYGVTWFSARSGRVEKVVKAEPTLLYFDGLYMESALLSQRVTRKEVQAAVRARGFLQMEQATAVVLETDGSLTVMAGPVGESASALEHVSRPGSGRKFYWK
jgi:uncharacterized membrane protein YcaP (DUF421 family)